VANHKSALKRARQNETKRIRNRAGRASMKTAVKNFDTALQSKGAGAAEDIAAVASAIDLAAKKGLIPKQRAARKIARLSKAVSRLG